MLRSIFGNSRKQASRQTNRRLNGEMKRQKKRWPKIEKADTDFIGANRNCLGPLHGEWTKRLCIACRVIIIDIQGIQKSIQAFFVSSIVSTKLDNHDELRIICVNFFIQLFEGTFFEVFAK